MEDGWSQYARDLADAVHIGDPGVLRAFLAANPHGDINEGTPLGTLGGLPAWSMVQGVPTLRVLIEHGIRWRMQIGHDPGPFSQSSDRVRAYFLAARLCTYAEWRELMAGPLPAPLSPYASPLEAAIVTCYAPVFLERLRDGTRPAVSHTDLLKRIGEQKQSVVERNEHRTRDYMESLDTMEGYLLTLFKPFSPSRFPLYPLHIRKQVKEVLLANQRVQQERSRRPLPIELQLEVFEHLLRDWVR